MGIILLILLQNIIFGSYIAFRLYQAFLKSIICGLLLLYSLFLSSTFLIARVLVRTLGIHLPHSIVFATHLILGFTNYFFMYLVATDILRLIFKTAAYSIFKPYSAGIYCNYPYINYYNIWLY